MHSALVTQKEIVQKAKGKKLLLFLDYDGTLTPIVRRPELAKLTSAQKKVLKILSQLKNGAIIIVSGRSRKDLRALFNGISIRFIGDHGFDTPHRPPTVAQFQKKRGKLRAELHRKISKYKGAWIETKPVTFTIHYREVDSAEAKGLISDIGIVSKDLSSKVPHKMTHGKKVIEFRPRIEWHKGKAISAYIQKIRGPKYPIYIGDDVTDEDAFKVINNRKEGTSIFVGKRRKTAAKYRLGSVEDVYKFLQTIYDKIQEQ